MLDVPGQIKDDYGKLLIQRSIQLHSHHFYQKWLRFYLVEDPFGNFCHKYNHDPINPSSFVYYFKNSSNLKIMQQLTWFTPVIC